MHYRFCGLKIFATRCSASKIFSGGNDVAGDEFDSYLNHKLSGLDSFRFEFAAQMIDNVFRRYFEDLIAAVAQRVKKR
jgi:hypothetical protein